MSRRRFRDERGRVIGPEACPYCGKVYRQPLRLGQHVEEHLYPDARGPEVRRWHDRHPEVGPGNL